MGFFSSVPIFQGKQKKPSTPALGIEDSIVKRHFVVTRDVV